MKKRKLHQEAQRAVTARFPIDTYAEILKEAEIRGSTVADVLRSSWSSYQSKNDMKTQFSQLEKRIMRQTFEICVAVAGLDSEERNDAKRQILNKLKG